MEKKPFATIDETSSLTVKVTVLIDDVIVPFFGAKRQPKNGEVDVTFFKWGFDMLAKISDPKGKKKSWRYKIKRLPSEIDIKKSSWQAKTGRIEIILYKLEVIPWIPRLSQGLEQDDSSSEDETVEPGLVQMTLDDS
ncbi:unnamed protein product [Lymnaea stagnalis]|uniref:Uncharacterized protein n=1 Tax=Lymnaea stagnalis TaxID=6523 RepID=A0AAV2HH16_LYMST